MSGAPSTAERLIELNKMYEEVKAAIEKMEQALQQYKSVQPQIAELEHYMTSGQWQKDYEAEESHQLPKEAPKTLQSQDTLYDLLRRNDELRRELLKVIGGDR